jgi:hypothetical protein
MIHISRIVIFFLFVASWPVPSVAQFTYNPIPTVPVHMPVTNWQIQSDDNDDEEPVGSSPSQRASPVYRPVTSRTRVNLNALAEKLKSSDPANGAQMMQLFATTDVISPVSAVITRFGLQKNNVAHAYALYWVVYWGLANNVHDTPSQRALQAVARQAERGFAANPEFAMMDDAAKQQAAEELMALTAIMDATSEQTKSNPELAVQTQRAALRGSRASGLKLDQMTLTEDGFVPNGKKRTDAGDTEGVEDKSLASLDTSSSDTGINNTQLALIAAAGGAGLAGLFLFGKAMGKKG